MKKLTFLFAIASLFFLNSCGIQFQVVGTLGGYSNSQQQQSQQQPCNGSYGNTGYYVYQNPNPPRLTSAGIRQCPQP